MWKTFLSSMDKKIYLKSRLINDFINYSLLQNDSLSANLIADKLFTSIGLEDSLSKCRKYIEELLDKYISFDELKVDGRLSNKLSCRLNIELKDSLEQEYKSYLDRFFSQDLLNSIIAKIVHRIELLIWQNGILNMLAAIDIFKTKLRNAAINMQSVDLSSVEEEQLQISFMNAKEITLMERLSGDNIDDIIEYRSNLRNYIKARCENLFYCRCSGLYTDIMASHILENIYNNIKELLAYAEHLRNSIPDIENNEEWNKDYDHLVPTDFYERNVENITAEQAFQMFLLQFFANNESWMSEHGLLKDKELCVFVSDNLYVDELLQELCRYIENDK